jgi:hypothetical protein
MARRSGAAARHPVSLATLLLPILVACDGGAARLGPPPRPGAPPSLRAAGPIERPWQARCEGASTFTGATSQVIVGTCQMSHLGRVTFVADETFVLGPVTTVASTTTFTAADGDLLYATATGTATFADDGTIALAGTWTVVGGTGRFAGATGTAVQQGTARLTSPTSGTGTYTLEGRLVY